MREIISAVFPNRADAERAVDWLRGQGVNDHAISVVSRRDEDMGAVGGAAVAERSEAKEDAKDAGKGALSGLGIGAAVGALFGLAAAAIPGIGPFITAGALAHVLGVTGGAAAAGAIVGGTSGGLAGALTHWGLNEAESHYYASEVEHGSTYVGVDLEHTRVSREVVEDAFRRFNGRFAS